MTMLGDDAQTAAVKITVQCAEVTTDVVKAALKAIVTHLNNRKKNPKLKHGLQKLKDLNKHGDQISAQDYTLTDLAGLKKEFKEYGLDFSVLKGETPDQATIFFKAKDSEQLLMGARNYLSRKEALLTKEPIRLRIKKAVAKAREVNQKLQRSVQKLFTQNKGQAR